MTSISDTEVVNAPGGLVELGFGTSYGTTVTATSLSSSNTIIISDVTVICDGSPVIIDFSTPITTPAAIAGAFIQMALYRDGSTFLGYAPASVVPSAATDQKPASFQFRDTPTAGVHTYRVVAYRDGGAGTASIGGASAAGWMPNILRVSKILQASQLLVTQSNAPIVTSLPSGNLVTGQEVDLYVTSPYAGYQRYKWNGSAWYVIGDSRAQGVWQSFTPTLTQSSNINFNINYAKYVMFGKTVMVNFSLSPTSSGVLNNNILLGFGSGSTALPTAASTNGIHGNFRWFDVGVSNWVGTICGSSTTSVFFLNDGNGNNTGFSGTLTNGDVIEGSFFYEMA